MQAVYSYKQGHSCVSGAYRTRHTHNNLYRNAQHAAKAGALDTDTDHLALVLQSWNRCK